MQEVDLKLGDRCCRIYVSKAARMFATMVLL
jgi:hypothetical protein